VLPLVIYNGIPRWEAAKDIGVITTNDDSRYTVALEFIERLIGNDGG
jgi:hypothetical protein